MNKTLATLACLFALSACGGGNDAPPPPPATSNAASTDTTTSTIPDKKAEHYIVGTDATYPPFDLKDEKGQITGFDMDVLRAIAENQGFSVEFVSTKRSNLFPTLNADSFQILAACLGINPERQANSELSTPYAYSPNVIMGKDVDPKPQTLAELSGKKVAVQKGSYTEEMLQKAQISPVISKDTLFSAYTDFLKGDADFVVGDAGLLSYFHKENTEANKPKTYTAVYDKNEDVRLVFAVKKGNTELIKKINEGLKNITENGTYDKIYAKWFGEDNSFRVPK